MKKIFSTFLLFYLFIFHQPMKAQNYYDLQWKKIEQNSKKGIFKTNLPLILEIQKKANQDQNVVQLIKSLKAEFSVLNLTNDDTENDETSKFLSKIKQFETNLKGDEKLLYCVLLTQYFKDYYDENSWEINNRTYVALSESSENTINTGKDSKEKIEDWSKIDFKKYISHSYSELEKEDLSMKKIQLEKYKELFEKEANFHYFPTLYDWNTTHYIKFLQNNQLFTPNELKENQQKILNLYDRLIASNSGNPSLFFEFNKLNDQCKFSHCKDRLSKLQKLYNRPENGDYKVMIATNIVSELTTQKKQAEALTFINSVKKQYPHSDFLNNIINLENQITQPSVSISYQKEAQSNQPIQIVANAKNASDFTIKIYETSDLEGFMNFLTNSYTHPFGSIKKSLVRTQKFELPHLNDYQLHKTAFEIEPLKSGIYLAEYMVNNEVNPFYFIVSDVRVLSENKNTKGLQNELQKLVNRENGKAVGNENLEIYEQVRGKTYQKSSVKTDDKGIFQFAKSSNKDYYRYYLIKSSGNNYQWIERYGDRNHYVEPVSNAQAQIFLDRAIYRPGQTVYFKVINTQLENKKESVTPNLNQKISLFDANDQEVSSQNFTTNAFGSYHGSFTLPTSQLNGSFSLKINDGKVNGYKSFRVEEYKRPNFEVTFEPVKTEYQYGQTIELKGKALSFSGIPLSDVSVNYEIKKKNIRWRYFWWFPQDQDNENSILGSTKTNDKGEFTISVELKKDETLEGIQIDNYTINASVTDINGETHSEETQLKVASVSHYILAENIGDIFTDQNHSIKVETKNYNDQILNKSFQAKLVKLKEPERIFRKNFESEIQDLPKFSKDVYFSKFPHDKFDSSENLKNWQTEKVIYEKTMSPENHRIDIFPSKADAVPGTYKMEFYNIEGKDTIKTIQYFQVWDQTKLDQSQKPFLKVIAPKSDVKRNEKFKIFVYSAIPEALVNIFVQNGDGNTKTEQRTLKNGILKYEMTAPSDENINQLNIQFQLAAYNDVQTQTATIKIAADKEPLTIQTITFRDKVQPGQKEKWTIKVSGGDKASAEVLANMYDQSLDTFEKNTFIWQQLYRSPYSISNYDIHFNLSTTSYTSRVKYLKTTAIQFPYFTWFERNKYQLYRSRVDAMPASVASKLETSVPVVMAMKKMNVDADDNAAGKSNENQNDQSENEAMDKIPVRKNLNETAFFYPDLYTDENGNVSFEFTSPEALTQWKLMFLAQTKDAQAATLEKTVITQKDFSVTPNYPRFLREDDQITLQSKLSNLTNQKLSGTAKLQILDAFTNEDVSEKFGLKNNASQTFEINDSSNAMVQWTVKAPENLSSVLIKITALAGNFSDGEQKAIAILPNRMLVTDALPIFVKEGQTKTFVLENLKQNTSTTATNVSNTLELTTNPIWEVIFALPSLKNDPNHSADVVFNKWFADVLASEIFKANPKIKTVFDEYQSKGLLQSNLEKNQELKQLLLEETPWVLESQNETEQMAKLSRLFDANTMRNSIQQDWTELKKLQNPDGGFSWYAGYPSSYYNSLYILKNLGRINQWLNGNLADYQSSEQKEMVSALIGYIDQEVNRYFDLKKENIWTNAVLDYLDTRHYWEKDFPLKGNGQKLKTAIIEKSKKANIKDFTFFGLHRAALLFNYYGLKDPSKKLMTYLKETSTSSETQGVYWKQNLNGWGWYHSKIVNQAGALEAFNKLTTDVNLIEEMKIWLVTQKEVSHWDTSRGTAEVIYMILNSGKSWTSTPSDQAEISWGGQPLKPQTQATGYVKETKTSATIDKNWASVTIKKDGPGIIQGGLFWQYYEDLNKIKSSESYISISKELFKKVKTPNGEELQKITEKTPLKVGDKVTVRMILNTDRPMEYIHLKDMRAAGFEPIEVLSTYQWKNNLGYYQSTKDASTNFYIEYMPKGRYVFEYDYLCNAAGEFSNGVTTLQNYYAPQMNAHSEGITVKINP